MPTTTHNERELEKDVLWRPERKLNLGLDRADLQNKLRQVKVLSGQTRAVAQSPNNVSVPNARQAGVPRQIDGLSVGALSFGFGARKIVVSFTRDPADPNYKECGVWVSGYRGNPNPVRVASGTESPIIFNLDSTGENVRVTVQPTGNLSAPPLQTCVGTALSLR